MLALWCLVNILALIILTWTIVGIFLNAYEVRWYKNHLAFVHKHPKLQLLYMIVIVVPWILFIINMFNKIFN